MPTLETLEAAVQQIQFARGYVSSLLADIQPDEWFQMPNGSPTHLAWQVGHLTMAQYGLCLFRARGRKPEDMELMPSKFRKQFSRGSTPDPDPANHATPEELLKVFARVYDQALLEMRMYTLEQLAQPADMPYVGQPTAMGAILFCPLHEMIHAGQIGMLRRLLGKQPVR